ncbi:F420-non-reducing hydrogenase, beta subunit, MvhB [Desulfamplus magnetovallimortis]|uniref:F420-non-reducing hydrogenase, beta subunit, MvhB n=1 Tax=Desulfamplus magnetovallimortis TaxID=1246637 RepID=A0A1W1HCY1_9BACT|nr:Coenzyme F420 hydrogenase/dehydrogenase, beta subunit C-terminal domain [Desulfamplus magnetovallimortis]SLM30296.1 F420-non-reducing hydrogenase, beta subunit, MvhB [Desulfamplus magnetovallimortis]
MKTFFNLVQDVQKVGLCHRCGGCVTFCTAINYGALKIDDDGKPVYADMEKCIECGLCYSICPEIDDLEEETKLQAAWKQPIGKVIETTVLRATDPVVRQKATDGGVVTALLLHLFDRHRIDGAIVTKAVGKFQRRPFLATTRQEILDGAGLFFDTSHGMKSFSDEYMTFSSIEEFDPMVKKKLNRVALVGTPCQIKSVRKMQVMNLVPSDAIKFCFGLYCTGNFTFGDKERQMIARVGNFSWDDTVKINLKDKLYITLSSGEEKSISLEELESIKRFACRYCSDYTAEFADISFGGLGAAKGWTSVLIRTPLGRAVLADARSAMALEQFNMENDPNYSGKALQEARSASSAKRTAARHYRRELNKQKPMGLARR